VLPRDLEAMAGNDGRGAAPQLIGNPMGEPPHIRVLLQPAGGNQFPPEGFVGLLGRSEPVSALRKQLSLKLEVPEAGVLLMHEGRNLLDDKTLTQNDVVLPGPASRRAGVMPSLFFDLVYEEVLRQRRAEADAAAEVERLRRQAEEMRRRAEEEERRRIVAALRWEASCMAQEERRQRELEELKREEARQATAKVLAGLPTELRRIEYTTDWGIVVEQRLREIAELAGITLQSCVERVSIVSARGGIIEAFAGDAVPMPGDFPFVLVFGPVCVKVRGPTHMHALRFAVEDARGLPTCWSTGLPQGTLVGVDSASDEFHSVTAYFAGTLGWLPHTCSLRRVQNQLVYSRFKGRHEPGLTLMFHGCRSKGNEAGILADGFQVSCCRSGGTDYGTWCAYASSYSDSGFVLHAEGMRHLFICVVSRQHVVLDNDTMRVVGQDCAYPLWLVSYRQH